MQGRATPALAAAAGQTARPPGPPEPAPTAPLRLLALLSSSRSSLSPLLPLCPPPCPLCPFAPLACRPPLHAFSAGLVFSGRPSVGAGRPSPKFTAERKCPGPRCSRASAAQTSWPFLTGRCTRTRLSPPGCRAILGSKRRRGPATRPAPPEKGTNGCSLRVPFWSYSEAPSWGPLGRAGVGLDQGAGSASLGGLCPGLHSIPARRETAFPPLSIPALGGPFRPGRLAHVLLKRSRGLF